MAADLKGLDLSAKVEDVEMKDEHDGKVEDELIEESKEETAQRSHLKDMRQSIKGKIDE